MAVSVPGAMITIRMNSSGKMSRLWRTAYHMMTKFRQASTQKLFFLLIALLISLFVREFFYYVDNLRSSTIRAAITLINGKNALMANICCGLTQSSSLPLRYDDISMQMAVSDR
jgi:hypothetical protein